MRKKLSFIFAVFLIFSLSISASATGPHLSYMYDYECHTLNGGVSGRYYWLDSTFSSNSTYSTMVSSSTNIWQYKTTQGGYTSPVALSRTTTRSQSMFDVLYGSVGAGSAGEARHYLFSGTRVNVSSTSNWDYVHLVFDTSNWSQLTNNEKQRCITHEFGHAFGLNHNLDNHPSFIMTPYPIRQVDLPHDQEIFTLRHLY